MLQCLQCRTTYQPGALFCLTCGSHLVPVPANPQAQMYFAYLCPNKFEELAGDSNVRRHCAKCQLEVTNLDALDDAEKADFTRQVTASNERVCVSVTQPADQFLGPCSSGPFHRLMGTVVPYPS